MERADSEASATKKVVLRLPAAIDARSATVAGDFNGWNVDDLAMTRIADGGYEIALQLMPGRRYHYRFFVDGERWENDWEADDYSPNIFGGDDSVIDLRDGSPRMTAPADEPGQPDPIDEEAAEIDARSPDAPAQIEELIGHAEALGRDAQLPGETV